MHCVRHNSRFLARLCAIAAAVCVLAGGASHAQAPSDDLSLPWMQLGGEFRERVEGFHGAGFTEGRDDVYFLSRLRLDATLAPGRRVTARLQVQDARVARKAVGSTGLPFRAPLDLRMAFVDIGLAPDAVAVRLGRQELAYGDQRLVGHVSWLNSARTFDGARATFRADGASLDVFAVSVVRHRPDGFDTSGGGSLFSGAHFTTTRLVREASIEPYAYWRREPDVATETGGTGNMRLMTVGVRWTGGLRGGWTYGLEAAVQAGRVGADAIDASAGHVVVRTPVVGRLGLGVEAEYNHATGDANPTDGARETFDQLFPTSHEKYGLADQVGWRNVHHLRLGARASPWRAVTLMASYHTWWLDETADALYSAGGAPLARKAAATGSGHVGHELDVQAAYPLMARLRVSAGYAHLFPGAFLREATPGASYRAPYLMATYVFPGE